jgi:uncharacterized membrane protein
MINKLRKYFLSGLVVFLPITLTVYSFVLLINFADGLLGKFLEPYFYETFGFYFRGLSIIVGVYLVIVIGFFATNYLGKRIYEFFENLLVKLPFFRQVYPAIKEMALFLFSRDKISTFKKVVFVEYPRKGVFSIGFFTNNAPEEICQKKRKELCNIFIPSAPGPLTGYVAIIPKQDIIFTDINIESAFKFIVSGGMVNPGQIIIENQKEALEGLQEKIENA